MRTSCGVPKRRSGVSRTSAASRAARPGPPPSIASHIGVRIAAGCTELHRMRSPCCAQYSATDFVWFRTAALLAP